MVFTDIRLQQFRSYKDASYELGSGVTIVVGPNGAGKTNLLEAVMLAATNKTYRAKNNLIKTGQDWARIDVHTSENKARTIKIQGQPDPTQQVEIDDKTYKRLPFSQKQPVVLFEPNHLFLTQGEPQMRRAYLDDLLEQLHPGFSKVRSDYRRALSQRNRLLKQGASDKTMVFAWNVRLIESAAQIVERRLKLIEELNKRLTSVYSDVADKKSKLSVDYKSSTNIKNYAANLLKQLENNFDEDLARGFTSYGPHRDDISILLNDEEISSTGSRGETRTLILALKIIELELLEETLKVRPLLLLDDVFSELDGARRKALVNFLKNHQTIITTTDADIVTKNFSQKCQIIPLG